MKSEGVGQQVVRHSLPIASSAVISTSMHYNHAAGNRTSPELPDPIVKIVHLHGYVRRCRMYVCLLAPPTGNLPPVVSR